MTFGARRGLEAGAARGGGGGRWKSQHRKIVHLSPYVEKPFNSKVIKSFVPELRSRKVFRVSGFLCYLYMSYEHSMYISHICIMGMLQWEMLYNLVMLIITMIPIHIQMQADSFVSDRNGLLTSGFSPWRHEKRDTILKSLR